MKRIILVDDDDAVRVALRSVLEPRGYQVFEAENGAKALSLPELATASLVITDIVMPDFEGTELIMRLRRERPDLKILALSGSPHAIPSQYLDVARKLGASATLLKPIGSRDLLEAVHGLIGE